MNTSSPLWRTFSIFISSTFADMQAERDHLKNVVFPKVEEELQQRRIKIEIVDLRWGVDTTSIVQEDEREANVLKVCLDEIKRCRPFFIGLLGDRYGWVPPLERIETAVVGEDIEVKGKVKSVTAVEIEFGVLASKEQLTRSVFYFREPLPYHEFSGKQAAMFSDEYNPELSETEKAERKTALNNLKSSIREHFENKNLKDKVKTYSGKWDVAKQKVTGLEAWGDIIYNDILAECESHAKETWDIVPKNWQEQELALLEAFIETNTQTFCGRKPLLVELINHLLSDDTAIWGLALTGESGSGKSAIFSMMNKMMDQEECFILAHSAGLSPRAKSVANLLQIWNRQLSDYLGIQQELIQETQRGEDLTTPIAGQKGKTTAISIEKLQETLLNLLQLTSAKKRVIIMIDALDRFEPTARAQHLSWLPAMMPKNVRLVLTTITGSEQKAVKYHKGLKERSIEVFSPDEAKEMLQALCKKQHKTLPEKVVKAILEKKRDDGQQATCSPLWLSLAVNMLMALDHDDFEKMSRLSGGGGEQIESYMGSMAVGFDTLPGPLFLSLVNKAGTVFGDGFTQVVFNCLACSRNGLRERDLEKILPFENIAWDALQFASLRRWFKAHLTLQGEELQWNLAHSILKNTLLNKMSETEGRNVHSSIACHLLLLSDMDSLKISESMYHLMQSDNRKMAANYYDNYLVDTPQTEGSSKILADAVIRDEALNETASMDWLLSLMEITGDNDDKHRTILNNFIFSLFDNHLKSDTTVNTRIKLILAVSGQIEELRRRAPDSEDYACDLLGSFQRLGDLYLKLGDPPKALDRYQTSLNILEELRRRAPDSAEYAYDLSSLYNRLGNLYIKLGDFSKALDKYLASQAIVEELRRQAPGSTDYDRDLHVSYNSLGDLYLQLGDPMKALDKYLASLNIVEELRQRAPDSTQYARDLSSLYHRLGDLYLKLGDPLKAFDKYQASLNIDEELRQRVPDSADYARDLSISFERLGDLFLKLGDPMKALDKYQASLNIREELRLRAPDSAEYARDLSISYDRLGDLFLKLGDPMKALDKYLSSLNIREELRQRAPDSAEYASDLSISYNMLGDLYLQLGDHLKALDKYQASETLAEKLRRRAPDSAEYARGLSISYNRLGDLYSRLGDHVKAHDKYQSCLKIAEELQRRAPDSAEYAYDISVSYDRLGNLYLKLGDSPKALDKYQASLNIREELRRRAPDSAEYARNLCISYDSLANLYHKLGDHLKSLDKYQASLNIREELRRLAPDSAEYACDLCNSYDNLGKLYFTLGDPLKALDKYQASLNIREELRRRAPDSVDYDHNLALLYFNMGELLMKTGKEKEGHHYLQEFVGITDQLYQKTKISKYQKWLEWTKSNYKIIP